MEYRDFGPLARPMSKLVLGTGHFHDAFERDSFQLLDEWRRLGGNSLDSAHVYRNGESEQVVGRWLETRNCRDDVVVITKGAHPIDDFKPRVTPSAIRTDLKESLGRLRTNFIDIYLLHRDDSSKPVGPILETLNELVAAGSIRCFGASNWTTERLDEAAEYAAAKGLLNFACSSPQLSLARQNVAPWPGCVSASDQASLQWYEQRQVTLLAWSSQAHGFFNCGLQKSCEGDGDMTRVYFSVVNWKRHARVASLAKTRGCSPNAVALGWVLAQPFPVHALIGPRTQEQLHSSMAGLGDLLTDEEATWLAAE